MIRDAISAVVERRDLSAETACQVMKEIMTGFATPGQVAAFAAGMRMKGEKEDEMKGFVTALRECGLRVAAPEGAVDLCGTGGDGACTFNVSTVASFVVSAAGVPVAKHGNRAVSSRSGSADMLQALGMPIDLGPSGVEECIRKTSLGIMFAPVFHSSMRRVAEVRREIGIRTLFNLLGPMANPAGVRRQLIGVYDPALAPMIARVMGELGSSRVLVVSGEGMDEITNTGPTSVVEFSDGRLSSYQLSPGRFGLDLAEEDEIRGGTPIENAGISLSILKGEVSARADIVAMNAGAALYVAGAVPEIEDGIDIARRTIRGGRGLAKLREFSAASVEIEKERQMRCQASDLFNRKILPDVLTGRCGEICKDLLSRVAAVEDGRETLANLDSDILSDPSVLSVLALSRALGVTHGMSTSTSAAGRPGRKLSETILSSPGVAIIGEFKPSSPTAPPLSLPPSPEEVAEVYPDEGVTAMSVLIENQYFGGGPELFSFFRSILSLPLIYKDFVLSVRQVEEADRLGADAVLLIAKLLKREAMEALVRAIILKDMEPVVEIHDHEDLEKLRSCSCYDGIRLIGINSRDLRTLRTDPQEGLRMREAVGDAPIVIMESGIRSAEQIRHLDGFDAALIGSMFMRAEDLRAAVRKAVAVGRSVPR